MYRNLRRKKVVLDIECFPNYFLISLLDEYKNLIDELEIFGNKKLNIARLFNYCQNYTLITFNGNNYDIPMLSAAMAGYSNSQLKTLSDLIITQGLRSWDLERNFNIFKNNAIDTIDLIGVMPGIHSLKMYMAKMHCAFIQELPYPPNKELSTNEMLELKFYCRNDLSGTTDAYNMFKDQIDLREVMSKTYSIDLRSKSDAQIAEAVIKKQLDRHIEKPIWKIGKSFKYVPPTYVKFKTYDMTCFLEKISQLDFTYGENSVELPDFLRSTKIYIGDSNYTIGIGGLHSNESKISHFENQDYVLEDVDVVSYYPNLILNMGLYPKQIGPDFKLIFNNLVKNRIAAKEAGDKKTSDSLKITINGIFGKTLSKYGILSSPELGIQTTLTGQLTLLMLIEILEMNCIHVISANTDGVVLKYNPLLRELKNNLIKDWETTTSLNTESVPYKSIHFRDVNSYIAIKKDGSVKTKGEYADSLPIGGSWPAPSGDICKTAVINYILNGTPIEETIKSCNDMREFLFVRTVNGGGVKHFSKKPKNKKDIEVVIKEPEYLGKVVRWYYANDDFGDIRYAKNGNLVPDTYGATPCLNLENFEVKKNIDYEKYFQISRDMLKDIGYTKGG